MNKKTEQNKQTKRFFLDDKTLFQKLLVTQTSGSSCTTFLLQEKVPFELELIDFPHRYNYQV